MDEDVVAMLVERTGGNPLFVCEPARLLTAESPAAAPRAVPTGVARCSATAPPDCWRSR